MTDLVNRRILLDSRPGGEPVEGNFLLDPTPVREPEDGEVLLKVLWLSLDPYMRGRMNDAESYAPPVKLGAVMTGETVCQVLRSRSTDYTEGEFVAGNFGWQEFVTISGGSANLRKVNPAYGPVSTALGILGMTGLTAYFGLLRVGKPTPGETVVVSAASVPWVQWSGKLQK